MSRAALSEAGVRLLKTPVAPSAYRTVDTPWTAPAKVDDRTADYLLSVNPAFETLGDITRSLAALLILEASGARVPLDHPALSRARADLAEAEALIRAGRPTPRAVHPHHHLVACVDRLEALMSTHGADTRRKLALLREATDHLNFAARALPGFEIVALGDGCACCASPGR